jgi:hypothetical protein
MYPFGMGKGVIFFTTMSKLFLGPHIASYPIGTGGSFIRDKAAGT